MVGNCALCRLYSIRLCIDAGRHASLMGAPVIEQSGNMHDFFRPVRQPQYHIMVLTAVKFRPEKLRSFHQPLCKHTEMTDIVVGAQVVRRIVRLKMHSQHPINVAALKGRLVTVQIIRPLLVNRLHISKERTRMQDIVVVEQTYIISRRHFVTCVRISCNSFIFCKLAVYNPAFRQDFYALHRSL